MEARSSIQPSWKTFTVGEADGILVKGGNVTIRDVYVSGFSRHGVNADSTLGGNANLWSFQGIRVEHNRGDGFHFHGMDANAGLCLLCVAIYNQHWGFFYDAVIPSTFVAPLTDGNHNDPTWPSAFLAVKQIEVANGIATLTSMAEHHTITGDWLVIRGCGKLSNKWGVIKVPTPTTLQFRTNLPDGAFCPDGSGTFGYQPGARVWATGRTVNDAKMAPGSYNLDSAAAQWTQADYGTLVCVAGAGPEGAELCSTIKLVYGRTTAVLADMASKAVHDAAARIVTNGGPYNTNNVTFVESYVEGNQEGLFAAWKQPDPRCEWNDCQSRG